MKLCSKNQRGEQIGRECPPSKCYQLTTLAHKRWLSVVSKWVVAAVALAACGESNLQSGGPIGAGGAAAAQAGSAAVAGNVGVFAGNAGTGSSGGPSSAGTSSSSGGAGVTAGSANVSGGSGGSSGGTPAICTDKQHPDHMGEPCSIWVEWDEQKAPGEAKDCDASWLTGAGYCLESCGKCQSNNGGNGGTGGSSAGGNGSGGTLGPGPNLPNVTNGQEYWASRYWDCCKPHCAQQGTGSCNKDGVSSNTGSSACSGGSAYACYSEAPRAIGTNVSYGSVAVPNPSCGTCYHLQFTGTGRHNANDPGSKAIAGKHMIVRVTNTGGDVAGNQFDLMVPGGGVGQNPNTCTSQWGVSSGDLGPTAGGFLSACSGTHEQKKTCVRQKCNLLPAGDARDGCLWFVDWYQVADNPNFKYEPTACPGDF
jgi:hypothetical protein